MKCLLSKVGVAEANEAATLIQKVFHGLRSLRLMQAMQRHDVEADMMFEEGGIFWCWKVFGNSKFGRVRLDATAELIQKAYWSHKSHRRDECNDDGVCDELDCRFSIDKDDDVNFSVPVSDELGKTAFDDQRLMRRGRHRQVDDDEGRCDHGWHHGVDAARSCRDWKWGNWLVPKVGLDLVWWKRSSKSERFGLPRPPDEESMSATVFDRGKESALTIRRTQVGSQVTITVSSLRYRGEKFVLWSRGLRIEYYEDYKHHAIINAWLRTTVTEGIIEYAQDNRSGIDNRGEKVTSTENTENGAAG